MKNLFFILSIIFSLFFIFSACEEVGCNGVTNCIEKIPCINNSDCNLDFQYCADTHVCKENPCLDSYNDCLVGTCIPGDNPETEKLESYYCQCDENSLPYKRIHGGDLVCTPKCKPHSDCPIKASVCFRGQCVEFDNYSCTQDSDCPEGEICNYNHCKEAPIGG